MALAMLRLIGIVLSIGLADSLNPSTLGPALYLAAGPRPRHTVAQFTAGVFLVYLIGGAVFAVGPGEIVLALVPKPDQTTRQVLEVVAGVVLITVGALLWSYRARLGEKRLPDMNASGRGGWLLGAMITAVELPTAFPYFAALAADHGLRARDRAAGDPGGALQRLLHPAAAGDHRDPFSSPATAPRRS